MAGRWPEPMSTTEIVSSRLSAMYTNFPIRAGHNSGWPTPHDNAARRLFGVSCDRDLVDSRQRDEQIAAGIKGNIGGVPRRVTDSPRSNSRPLSSNASSDPGFNKGRFAIRAGGCESTGPSARHQSWIEPGG